MGQEPWEDEPTHMLETLLEHFYHTKNTVVRKE